MAGLKNWTLFLWQQMENGMLLIIKQVIYCTLIRELSRLIDVYWLTSFGPCLKLFWFEIIMNIVEWGVNNFFFNECLSCWKFRIIFSLFHALFKLISSLLFLSHFGRCVLQPSLVGDWQALRVTIFSSMKTLMLYKFMEFTVNLILNLIDVFF